MSGIFDTSTLIAFGLIGIAIVILLIDRMAVLPRKTLPFIAAALAGAFGIAILRGYRSEKIKKKEEELAKKEEIKEQIKNKYEASGQATQIVEGELEQAKAASKKQRLLIEATSKEEKERIEKMSIEELYKRT